MYICCCCCCCLIAKLYRTLLQPQGLACQAPLSMGFPRQEYWRGLPFPFPGNLPNPGIKPVSPALAGRFFTAEPPGKPISIMYLCEKCICSLSEIQISLGILHFYLLNPATLIIQSTKTIWKEIQKIAWKVRKREVQGAPMHFAHIDPRMLRPPPPPSPPPFPVRIQCLRSGESVFHESFPAGRGLRTRFHHHCSITKPPREPGRSSGSTARSWGFRTQRIAFLKTPYCIYPNCYVSSHLSI